MSVRMHRTPHQIPRYAPVLKMIDALPPDARVLEVGSGCEGIGTWRARPFVGVDLEFGSRRARSLRPVGGDGMRLPFASETFDLVVCVAVLPHVRGAVRPLLRECVRVCRGCVTVVTPCGIAAAEADRRAVEGARARGENVPVWLAEQLDGGVPSFDEIRGALSPHGCLREITTLSVEAHARVFRMEQRMRRARAMTFIQPVVRAAGRVRGHILSRAIPTGWRSGVPYEVCFVLERHATSSPPRASS